MSLPLIGITIPPKTAPDRAELDSLLEAIVRGVERAGGLPLLIPLHLSETTLQELYTRLDGLLVSGGGDIDPVHYGAEMHAGIDGVDAERDRTEMTLVRWMAKDSKPFFGICRGAQVLNVTLGGTLYRDVSEHAGAGRHSFYPDLPNDLRAHEIKIEEESTLAKVIGRPITTVNSLHHQSVKEVAPGLRAVAQAPDGIIEAVEIPDRAFAVGVQWHPECLPEAPEMRALFEAFVVSAKAAKRPITNN
jgi:putative glutamine amidotransferase